MSTKSHFICGDFIEGFEETSEPKNIFGKFIGYNCYLIIENNNLKSFGIEGNFLTVSTKDTKLLPSEFKIWGGAILDFYYDMDCLCVHLDGGHPTTEKIIKRKFE